MTRIKLLPLALLAFLCFALVTPVALIHLHANSNLSAGATPLRHASPMNYDFRVLNNTVHVYPQIDASVFINYSITFENYGTEFEYIDVGLPNPFYDLASFEAYWSLEGAPYQELTSIAPSSVISVGIEFFVPQALRPGNGEECSKIRKAFVALKNQLSSRNYLPVHQHELHLFWRNQGAVT